MAQSEDTDADAAAFAALCIAESVFLAMIRGGSLPRGIALDALDHLAGKIANRSPAHARAAKELMRFRTEVAAKTGVN